MDKLLKALESEGSSEKDIRKVLKTFVVKNQSNFGIEGSLEVKETLCKNILQHLSTVVTTSNLVDSAHSLSAWTNETTSLALSCLRILARGKVGMAVLCSGDAISTFASLGDIGTSNHNSKFEFGINESEIQVIVEAVKCLCNIYLINRHLVTNCADHGIIYGLTKRLSLHHMITLPHDVIFYDLRLLFLLTACDPHVRVLLRDKHDGLKVMNSIIDCTLFGPHVQVPPSSSPPVVSTSSLSTSQIHVDSHVVNDSCSNSIKPVCEIPMRLDVVTLSQPLNDDSMNVLCEVLKIFFNQTVHWKDEQQLNETELHSITQLGHLLRILLLSLPAQHSSLSLKTISHVAEVLVTVSTGMAKCLLLSPESVVTTTISEMYPHLYPKSSVSGEVPEGGVSSGVGVVYTLDLDRQFDGFNMAPIVALLNLLYIRLCGDQSGHVLPPVLTALRGLSRGHRSIRRFLRAEILPTLGKVTQRPEEGDSLKSKLIRLMTISGNHGAEEVIAELLFVLCKENASRLIKYTGYGNAAGLLMTHGLLGGGVSEVDSIYSSDEDSDTEEYTESQAKIDPMTGGLAEEGPSPLDNMTEEEKEKEAAELHVLIQRLNQQGIFKMVPVDEDQKPIQFPKDDRTSDNDHEN